MPNGETREATRESLKPCRLPKEKNRKPRASDPTKQKPRRASHSKQPKQNSSKGDSELLKKALRRQHVEDAPKMPVAVAVSSSEVAHSVESGPREEDPPFVKAFLKEVDEARESVYTTDASPRGRPEEAPQVETNVAEAEEDHTTPVPGPAAALMQPSMPPGSKEKLEDRIVAAPGTPVQSIQGLLRGHQVLGHHLATQCSIVYDLGCLIPG